HEDRAADPGAPPVLTNGLGDRQNVRFGERAVKRAATMAAGAKADRLHRIGRIRVSFEVVAFELVNIHQQLRWSGFASQWMRDHRFSAVAFPATYTFAKVQSPRSKVQSPMAFQAPTASGFS